MKLGNLFTNEVVTIRPGGTFAEVTKLMESAKVGSVVVAEGDRPVGIITDRDVAMALGKNGLKPADPVQKVMTCPVVTINVHDGVCKATKVMSEQGVRRLVVLDDAGRMTGVLGFDDLLFLLGKEIHNLSLAAKPEKNFCV
jgi:CBS domain-containing protein